MNPVAITLLLIVGWLSFFWSAWLKLRVMARGLPEPRFDRLYERTKRTLIHAFGQARMPRYLVSGATHMLIFWGFLVLLLHTIVLWGRGYSESFCLWTFCDTTPGRLYAVVKDAFVIAVFAAATIALVNRLVNRKGSASRMTHTAEAYIILLIIWTMMAADTVYDWADVLHRARVSGGPAAFSWAEPIGSWLAVRFPADGMTDRTVDVFRQAGFWGHSTLVLIFLNILPYTKHFHIITAIPNVFLQNLDPPGRLKPIEDIYEQETYGLRTVGRLSWKSMLDLYTCTECGRCSDNCPAWTTGKLLSPKQLTIDLRRHLDRGLEAMIGYGEPARVPDLEAPAAGAPGREDPGTHEAPLVPGVVKEEVVWGCTTCRACEEACPVFISYVDKIVDLRRHLVLERGEVPGGLAKALHGLETNSNPWNLSALDRAAWGEGLDVPLVADTPRVEVLLWIGCAPSFDDRARKVARAMVQLLRKADVKFATLGNEEHCTGDLARRAGNEALFEELARSNIETLDKHGIKRIVTICPHCYNTLANEYPDFGGNYLVLSHAELLLSLIGQGKLRPGKAVEAARRKIVFHDPCYLGRTNDIYDEPRAVLRSIPGVEIVECERSRARSMCCGAGGTHAFKEEEPAREGAKDIAGRVNARRVTQLLDTGAETIATACPYCMLMLTDGLKAGAMEEKIRQEDIAEILLRSISP